MSFLTQMYGGRKQVSAIERSNEKNPNRVAGGLRAQGVDTFSMLGEDGMEKRIPTHAYVQSLEEQIRKQRAVIDVLERKVTRLQTSVESIQTRIVNSR
jgi:hypothetical protein